MSKIGLGRRTKNIEAAMKAHNPRGYAIYRLPPKLRQSYDAWRAECDRIAALYNGSLYEALLAEHDVGMPPMPAAVAAAIDTGPRVVITKDMSLTEVADIWRSDVGGTIMTDHEKLALFKWVSVRNRRLNLGIIGGRVALVFSGGAPPNAHVVDRLDVTVREAEGVSQDGRTLKVGALGIVLIGDYLTAIPTYARSPKRLHERLCQLFAGSAYFPEMLRGAIRAACSLSVPRGDCGFYADIANRQMQSWSAGNIDVNVGGGATVRPG